MINQERSRIKSLINENPVTIIIYRQSLKDDGFGGIVNDPFGIEQPYVVKCRISHERQAVPDYSTQPPGLSTNLNRFILVDWQTNIKESDIFEAIGKQWKIGVIDPLYRFGVVIGYQAPLLEAIVMQEAT